MNELIINWMAITLASIPVAYLWYRVGVWDAKRVTNNEVAKAKAQWIKDVSDMRERHIDRLNREWDERLDEKLASAAKLERFRAVIERQSREIGELRKRVKLP
jgi:hypothetical protein